MLNESETFKKYQKDLSKLPLLGSDEQLVLVKEAQAGSVRAAQRLTEGNLRFVVTIAKEYLNSGIPIDDLVNEGNIGLIKSINKFNTNLEYKFISYAVWWIRQGIIQSIYESSEMIRMPINRIGIKNKILKAKEILFNELHRDPTVEELSSFTEIAEKDVKIFLNNSGLIINLEVKENAEDGETVMLTEMIEGDGLEGIEKGINKSDVLTEIDISLNTLNARESEIIRLYYGLNKSGSGINLGEIGMEMNLTNERVRQIKSTALKKLRTFEHSSKLREFLEYNF